MKKEILVNEFLNRLDYSVCELFKLGEKPFQLFRNSLVACSKLIDYMFVAIGEDVFVYNLLLFPIDLSEPDPLMVLHCPHKSSSIQQGDLFPGMPNGINHIRCELLGDLEYLITATDCGKVAMYDVKNLQRNPMTFSVDSSAWGIAISSERYLAISSNAHVINIFNLSTDYKQCKRDYRSPWFRQESLELVGHQHNIPCVSFNSKGNLLLSGSIDRTLQLWDINELSCLSKFHTKVWIWSVKFVDRSAFTFIPTVKDKIETLIPARTFGQTPWNPAIFLGLESFNSDEDDYDDDAVFEGEYYVHMHNKSPDNLKSCFRTFTREPPEEIFVFATKYSVVLCGYHKSQIYPFVSCRNCFEDPSTIRFEGLHRINMMEYVPQIQSLVCATQSGQLSILRLIATEKVISGQVIYAYSFIPQIITLNGYVDTLVLGMSVAPWYPGNEDEFQRFKILLVLVNGQVLTVEIQLSEDLYATNHVGNILI
ncbi:WD repeat protein [Schizosaccharomyces octosporus yFS286]|uniref:WD repeat protein n=1 Tax=Schizosaccharomyces octosporus (strain yFS286) TaxID=483514 RepID=S9PYL2_SCHOY|nr:WD repeat protein [Schizosaccharomyces octosporus yFS286]EPX74166.1 WD repeat protein [Schizosaccharomyces octosporus yFS286]